MKEGYIQTFGTLAGSFVDYAAAFFLNFCKSVGHTVFHSKSYVLDASATAVVGNELGDGALGSGGFEELNLGLTYFEESCADFLVWNFFNSKAFETKHILIERNSFVEARNGDAYMFNV